MNKVTRIVALPLISAGILAGGLGLAGPAAAAVSSTSTNGNHSMVATPHTKAGPSHNATAVNSLRHRYRHHNAFWRH